MRIEATRDCYISGQYCPAGSIVTIDDGEGRALLRGKSFRMAGEEVLTTAEPTQTPRAPARKGK